MQNDEQANLHLEKCSGGQHVNSVSCARWVVTLRSRLKVRPILMMAQFRWRAPEQWCAAEGFGPSRRLAPGPSTEPSEGPMPRSCVYQFRHARVEQSIGDKLTTIQLNGRPHAAGRAPSTSPECCRTTCRWRATWRAACCWRD